MKEEIKVYEKLKIDEIESKIETAFKSSRESQKEMYMMLYYLYTSKRFRENPRYKKASFDSYLNDRFTMRMGTFREGVRAFSNYADFAVEYGAGLVTKISNTCGFKKVSKVISEIEKEEKQHKIPMTRMKIEAVIQKYAKPKIEKKITDWHAMYEAEAAAHEQTRIALGEARLTIKELNDQIRKLKVTAERITDIRAIIEKPVMQANA